MNQTAPHKWYAFIPNMITSFNLICGVIAVYFAFNDNVKLAVLLMITGAFFDFIDGFSARLLKVSGELGKQLDSLADMITFGFLPGVLVFSVQRKLLLETTLAYQNFEIWHWIYFLIPILIPVFSAIRLAKFNIDTRQTNSFIGVPTPASALFFAALSWSIAYNTNNLTELLSSPIVISMLVVLFAYLMNAELPLFALKFKTFGIKENAIRYIFILLSLLLIVLLKIPGILMIIILYIALSLAIHLLKKKSK